MSLTRGGLTVRAAIHGLFLLSGVAGLVYQVAWVRAFSLVFGSSVHSASVVTATFLAGLGIGGWLAGSWADRYPERLLGAWGRVEIAIGVLGLGVIAVLPRLLPLSAALSSYVETDAGWSVLSTPSILGRVAVAAAVIAPSAMAMGATLTLLVRDQVADAAEAGWRIGWLYGANTAGAALGAAVADTVLVPALGLTGTQLLAVGINIVVGGLALGMAPWRSARPLPPFEGATPRRAPLALLAALFLAGLAAMGLEMAWFRFLAGALGPYRAVFSLLLATLLAGHALGAALGGQLHRRFGHPVHWFVLAQALVVLTALWGFAAYDPYALVERQHAVVADFEAGGRWARAGLLLRVNGVTILGLVGLPAVAMGAAFPLGNAIGQDATGHVGRRVGGLYFATTAGNVTGALLTGFVLLPGPGIQTTVALLAGAALLGPALLVREGRSAGALAPGLVALGAFATLPGDHLVWNTFPYGRAREEGVLELREGLEQILVVTGHPEGPARLWTSGHPMTSTTPHAQRYMRAMAHVPLLLRDDPEAVLVICVGAGNTVHAATLHPSVERVDAVDLSADVLAVNHLFAHSNGGVLGFSQVHPYVNDGRHHLLLQPEGTYDLVTLEPPPLAVAGVSALYSADFYRRAASRLTEDGVVAQWLPAYQVPEDAVRSLVRAFVDVFPEAVLLVGSGRELILLGSPAPLILEPTAVARRLEARPAVAADLERLGLGSVRELASTFAADRGTLVAATAGFPPVTDDRPILESAQASHLMKTRLPADLFAPERIDRWCPACEDPVLDEVLTVTGALYGTEAFLTYRSAVPDLTSVLSAPDLEDATLAAIARSESLTRVLVAPDALALRAQELWDAGRPEEARLHLAAARAQAPGVPLLESLAADWAGEGTEEPPFADDPGAPERR